MVSVGEATAEGEHADEVIGEEGVEGEARSVEQAMVDAPTRLHVFALPTAMEEAVAGRDAGHKQEGQGPRHSFFSAMLPWGLSLGFLSLLSLSLSLSLPLFFLSLSLSLGMY